MKKFLDNFFELRKHLSCIILSLIGLGDIICGLLIPLSLYFGRGVMFIILMSYIVAIRLRSFLYYAPIILILFIIEKKKNMRYENDEIINDSRAYKVIWVIGFTTALIVSLVIPVILIMYPE